MMEDNIIERKKGCPYKQNAGKPMHGIINYLLKNYTLQL